MTLEEVVRVFDAVRSGSEWKAKCPCHDDSKASLFFTNSGGKILVKCHALCDTADVLASKGLRLSDLFDETLKADTRKKSVVAEYDYFGADGRQVFQVVRFDPKDFRQRHKDASGEWVWKMEGVERVPYRLPELLSSDPDDPVFIVEGEKDADKLTSERLVATTNPGGAGKWRHEYSPFLQGRRVVILPDNDETGFSHAQQVEASLSGIAASIRILKLAGVPPKGDVSDWLAKGHTIEELIRLSIKPDLTRPFRLDELADSEIPDPDTFVDELLARGSICLIAGRRGSGKTYFTLAMAASIALGTYFGHLPTHQAKVLYCSQEMSAAAIRKRIRRLFPDPEQRKLIGQNLTIVCKRQFKLNTDDLIQPLLKLVSDIRPDVVFIDALRDVKGSAKENSNDDMGDLLVRLRDQVAVQFDCGVVLIHHKGKLGEDGQDKGSRGASALEDVPEDIIYLHAEKGAPRRRGDFEKTREGELEGKNFWYEISSDDEHEETVLFAMGSGDEDSGDSSDFARAEKLAIFLSDQGELTKAEVMTRMAWTKETTRLAIRAGKKAKMIDMVRGGGRGNSAYYKAGEKWLTPSKK